jgi:zona occludens toxin (predicted ATPase)
VTVAVRVPLDALVRGRAGATELLVTGRVFRVTPHGHVALIDADGRQRLVAYGQVEFLDKPRPVAQRRDIPAHLRAPE